MLSVELSTYAVNLSTLRMGFGMRQSHAAFSLSKNSSLKKPKLSICTCIRSVLLEIDRNKHEVTTFIEKTGLKYPVTAGPATS
jgi:hypothetical protein